MYERNVVQRIQFLQVIRYITYNDIRRESPPAMVLKWSHPLSLANIWLIISHNWETVEDRRLS